MLFISIYIRWFENRVLRKNKKIEIKDFVLGNNPNKHRNKPLPESII